MGKNKFRLWQEMTVRGEAKICWGTRVTYHSGTGPLILYSSTIEAIKEKMIILEVPMVFAPFP
jgi:hypothetical protein